MHRLQIGILAPSIDPAPAEQRIPATTTQFSTPSSSLFNLMATRAISASAAAATVSTRNTNPINSRHVAVIGAGAAGLAAAQELRREGHRVVVYEWQSRIGGTWVFTPETEPDPLGLDPDRPIVHSSVYKSLRTNLPREVMGFREYPFVPKSDPIRDPRRYPGHQEVLDYLRDYAAEFGIEEMVRFDREVVSVGLVDSDDYSRWRVKSRNRQEEEEEEFDAVVVCNGHYTEPRVAEITGIDTWPGKQMHSHNYRVPDPFKDQVVILIGSAASAVDISRDIASVAKEVHVAIRSSEGASLGLQPGYTNMWLHPMIKSVHEDGAVVFVDGTSTYADTILHCTGYKYHFPFLDTQGIVTVDDNRVGPLYQHVFPPALAPWLSFMGLTWKVVPFPQFELQSKWIAGALSGKIALPSQKEMMDDIEHFYANLESAGIAKRYTHNQSKNQFEYNNWLAEQCGVQAFEDWKIEMYKAASKNKVINPETYRDKWEDYDLIRIAYEDFAKQSSMAVKTKACP